MNFEEKITEGAGCVQSSPAKIKICFFIIVIFTFWAGIYLLNLGCPDIDQNEARRIFPAINMLETENFVNPTLAGIEYYRKPPLMDWMIAGSFLITGEKSNFTARLPTSFMVLFSALSLLLLPMEILNLNARFISSIIFLTTAGMIGLGRTANIDPNYVCVTGIAIVLWLRAWARDSYDWRMWIFPSVAIGFGLLLKGPLILMFYYVMVITVLYHNRKLRSVISFSHFWGVAVMFLIFGTWAYFSSHGAAPTKLSGMYDTWYSEMAHRFTLGELSFSKWLGRVMGGIAQFLPWLLFLPLFWFSKLRTETNEKKTIFLRSSLFTLLVVFICINALPVTKARYSLPLLPLLCITLGVVISEIQIKNAWMRKAGKSIFIIILLCGLTFVLAFALTATGWLKVWFRLFPAIQSHINVNAHVSFAQVMVVIFIFIIALFAIFKFRNSANNLFLITGTGFVILLATCFYSVFLLPFVSDHEAREFAAKIDASVPNSDVIYGINYVGREPYLFYMKTKMEIVADFNAITGKADYLLLDDYLMGKLDEYKEKFVLDEESREELSYKHGHHQYFLIHLKERRGQ